MTIMADVTITLRPQIVEATLTGGTLRVVVQTGTSEAAGVSSFNGRTGAVTPATGDYTAAQITETAERVFVSPEEKTAIGTALQTETDPVATAALSEHIDTHPAPFNRDDRNQIAGSYEAGGAVAAHNGETQVHGALAGDRVALLSELPADPEQSDWNEADSGSLAFIANKPTIPAEYTDADARTASGSLPVVALGTISGTQAIDWDGESQAVTATVDGTATTLTKGTGWPAAGLAEVRLTLTVTGITAITWTIATDVANWPDSFAIGKHILVLSSLDGTITAIYSVQPEAL